MKQLLRGLGALLILLVILMAGYVFYVLHSWYRLDDALPLTVEGTQTEPVPVGTPLRALSYNVGFGAYSDDYSFFMDGGTESRARSPEAVRENLGGALRVVQERQPDFVLFQEVDVDGTRSHHIDQYAAVKNALPGYDSVFAQNYDSPYLLWPPASPHGANRAGTVFLSRFKVSSALRRQLPIESGPRKLVDLDRCYSVNRLPTDQGPELVFYLLHLSAYTSDGSIANQQLELLFQDMSAEAAAGNYVIAGGDFNKDLLGNSGERFGVSGEDAPWAQPIPPELIPEGITLTAPFDPEQPVASCRNADRPLGPDSFLVTVDGFLVSGNVSVLNTQVLDTGFRWSDHNPVTLEFQLN